MTKRIKKIPTCVLDLDDTVLGFLSHLCHIHNVIYGSSIHANDISEWDICSAHITDVRGNVVTGEQLLNTFKEYEPHGLYAQLPLLPHADHAISLMKKLGYKVIAMTARKSEFEQQTKLNLIQHNLPIDEIIFTDKKPDEIKRLQKTHRIVMFVDDKLSTVENVFENCRVGQVFIIDMKHNQSDDLDENIKRIGNLFESVRYLKEV